MVCNCQLRTIPTVCSTYASLSHAGVHPFIKNPGPSFVSDVTNILTKPCPLSVMWQRIVHLAYWGLPIRRSRALHPALQNIGRCANSRCNSSRCQRGRDVYWDTIREIDKLIREQLALCGCVSNAQLACTNQCCLASYTAI